MVFGVVNSYSEAVFNLCKDFRPGPSIVLLRPILEGWINATYFLSHNHENRLRALVMYDSFSKLGLLEEMRIFSKNYPWITEKTVLCEKNLEAMRKKVEKDIEELKQNGLNFQSKNEIKSLSYFDESILDRARKADRKHKNPNPQKPLHPFEYQYQVVYRYFSDYSHISLVGTNNFLKKRDDGWDFMASQSNDDVEMVLVTLDVFYLSFLNKLKTLKLISVPNLSKFNKHLNTKLSKK